MLNYFEEKKTFFAYKKTEFFKVQTLAYFSKGLTHDFGQNMPNFSLLIFGQNNTKDNA